MRHLVIATLVALFSTAACGGGEEPAATAPEVKPIAEPEVVAPEAAKPEAATGGRTLLVAQSQFAADDKGAYTVPDAAVLTLLRPAGKKWAVERIEDRESNVFHKALPYGEDGILTLGANEAKLKLWKKVDGKWAATTLWHPTFGGKHNRLRDFEIADFDGDGADDLAIATHDQGVLAVVWRKGGEWKVEELDRQADVFVHEIEVGDLDKDGKLEFYATPSAPNTLSGKKQGGEVVRMAWTGEKFEKSVVVALENRHVKEILVADVDGDGTQELYAALEAEVEGGQLVHPVEIRRFDLVDGKLVGKKVVEIQDRFCRFLVAGDVDGDGQNELVAAPFSAGVFVIEKKGDAWESTCIDKASGGFEHAAYLADVDGNGKLELYVADDNGGVIRRYVYENGAYKGDVINRRVVAGQAMVWNITVADL